tara:strand:- start:1014 stop:1160 length:147 start_codon:yes stop_codon:yes gene_type:complete
MLQDLKIYGSTAIALAISITEINLVLQTVSLVMAICYAGISIFKKLRK